MFANTRRKVLAAILTSVGNTVKQAADRKAAQLKAETSVKTIVVVAGVAIVIIAGGVAISKLTQPKGLKKYEEDDEGDARTPLGYTSVQ